jgi:hypothetical protein
MILKQNYHHTYPISYNLNKIYEKKNKQINMKKKKKYSNNKSND